MLATIGIHLSVDFSNQVTVRLVKNVVSYILHPKVQLPQHQSRKAIRMKMKIPTRTRRARREARKTPKKINLKAVNFFMPLQKPALQAFNPRLCASVSFLKRSRLKTRRTQLT